MRLFRNNHLLKPRVIAMLLTLFAAHVIAQEPTRLLQGLVLASGTESPLIGANILIKGTTYGGQSNTKGEVQLLAPQGKEVTLQISYMGFEGQTIQMKAHETHFSVSLRESENQLQDVVVTGTRTPKPLKEVAVLTRVVSSQDIKRINPTDFQMLLEYEIPGLQFGRAHGSNLPTITFQGMEGPYVLFLLNGERMAGEGASGNVDFSRINTDDIERIEVVRGAMSTLYGSNAMGGVVNIITKSANRPFIASLNGRLDSWGGHRETASVGGKMKRFSTLTTATHRTEEAYEVIDQAGKPAFMTGYDILDISQRLGWTPHQNIQLSLDGSYYENKQLELRQGKTQDRFRSYTLNPRLRWMTGERSNLHISYLLDHYNKDVTYRSAIPADRIYEDFKQTLRADYTLALGEKQTFTTGLEYEHEHLMHYRLKDSATVIMQNYVLFAQEDWKVTDKLNLVAGVRADIHSDFGVNPSPKISVLYHLGKLSFRTGYAMGFRFPTLLERYEEYDMAGLGIFTIHGNPDLQVETSHQVNASLEYTNQGYNCSASGYYNAYQDKITMRLIGDGTSDQGYFNADHGKTTGLDLTAQKRFRCGLTLKGSYSFVQNFEYVEGYNVSATRPHSATFNALYSKAWRNFKLHLAFNGRWVSGVEAWYEDAMAGWLQTDYHARTLCAFNVGITPWRGIQLGFNMDNLFDFKDAQIGTDASLIPERGRSYALTLGLNFEEMLKL